MLLGAIGAGRSEIPDQGGMKTALSNVSCLSELRKLVDAYIWEKRIQGS